MAIRLGISIIVFLVICSCQSRNGLTSPSDSQPGVSPNTATNSSRGDIKSLQPEGSPTLVAISDAVDESEKIRKIAFQERCSKGLTYTYDGSQIIEIENFKFSIEKDKVRPDPVEQKNDVNWVGEISITSTASRSYDILNGCWFRFNHGLNSKYSLIQENGIWRNTLPNYQSPTCEDVNRYLKGPSCK